MAGMQRFVTYLYSYRGNEKLHNIGFAKIEIRGEQCRLEIHLKGTGLGSEASPIYMFSREGEQLKAVEIGSMNLQGGNGEYKAIFKSAEIGNSSYAIKDMAGILILVNESYMFAGQWDEKEVRRDAIKIWASNTRSEVLPTEPAFEPRLKIVPEEAITEPKVIAAPEAITEPEVIAQPEAITELETITAPEAMAGPEAIAEPKVMTEPEAITEPEVIAQPEAITELETITAPEAMAEPEALAEPEAITEPEAFVEPEAIAEPEPIAAANIEPRTTVEPWRILSPFETATATEEPLAAESTENVRATEIPMRQFFYQNKPTMEKRTESVSESFLRLQKKEQTVEIFESGDRQVSGIHIELRDIRELPKRFWYLGNNSFLLHGFFNYRYLLLGKRVADGEETIFLGVPGVQQSQERVMATMFGFPEFLMEKEEESFGYYCHAMIE